MINSEADHKFNYIKLISLLKEINRPSGGKKAVKKMLDLMSVNRGDHGLDVGCNTGFCTLEAVRIKKVKMTGLDISSEMVDAANAILKSENDFVKDSITYIQGDATSLPFKDNSFDFVFSGGSTIFVNNIGKALEEYKRVVKDWGFVGELNFFYKDTFPKNVVEKINQKLGIEIKNWNLDWWLKKYNDAGLEIFQYEEFPTNTVSNEKIVEYVNRLETELCENEENKKYVLENKDRLIELYKLFNENNIHLYCGVFILRKRFTKEEPYLFNP